MMLDSFTGYSYLCNQRKRIATIQESNREKKNKNKNKNTVCLPTVCALSRAEDTAGHAHRTSHNIWRVSPKAGPIALHAR